MKKHSLSLVGESSGEGNPTAVALQGAEDLNARARSLSHDQLAGVQQLLEALTSLAATVARSGSDLSPGVREVCRQISDEASYRAKSLGAIIDKTSN